MSSTTYTRPAKTKAASVGAQGRSRWTRQMRSKVFSLINAVEFMAAEEGAANSTRKPNTAARPRWVSVRVRIDHVALIEMLQTRHLKATGKEISRAEALAALMAEGLEPVLNHQAFGGKGN